MTAASYAICDVAKPHLYTPLLMSLRKKTRVTLAAKNNATTPELEPFTAPVNPFVNGVDVATMVHRVQVQVLLLVCLAEGVKLRVENP